MKKNGRFLFYIRALILTVLFIICFWIWGAEKVAPFVLVYLILESVCVYFYRRKKA